MLRKTMIKFTNENIVSKTSMLTNRSSELKIEFSKQEGNFPNMVYYTQLPLKKIFHFQQSSQSWVTYKSRKAKTKYFYIEL